MSKPTLTELLERLEAKASPKPWTAIPVDRGEARLFAADGRHGIATFMSQGHSDPLACGQEAALAVNHFGPLVAALEAARARLGGHSPDCRCATCDNAQQAVDAALAAVRRDIEKLEA